MKTSRYTLPLAIAAALALAACGDRTPDTTADAGAPGAAADPVAAQPTAVDATGNDYANNDAPGSDAVRPTDGGSSMPGDGMSVADEREALGVLNAINEHEVAAGRQALEKGVQGPVAEYAQMMIDAHTANREQTMALNPDPSAAAARDQAAKGQAKRDALAGHDGDAYSRAYVEAMVADHEQALATLDATLIPAAQSADVREHLEVTRQHVADHLERARTLAGMQ